MKIYYISFLFCLSHLFSQAQFLNLNPEEWFSKYKHELHVGLGGTQFLGDLGGQNGKGKTVGIGDMDFRSTEYEVHLGYRYRLHPLVALTTNLYAGKYFGSDDYTSNWRRNYRNITVRGTLLDLSQRVEFIYFSKYKLDYKKDKTIYKRFEAYAYTGIGMILFNPLGVSNYGDLARLHDLRTEGQGYPNGTKEYKRYSAVIPFGFGIQKNVSRRNSIRFELTYVKTFTDYMDDTSGKYFSYQYNWITASPEQVYYSNPSEDWATFKNGDPRGGKGKDCYFYASFSFVKTLGLRKRN